MAELRLASFNTHYGFRALARRRGDPYDVGAVLDALDADVLAVQEVWRPDGRSGAVDDFAARRGYAMHHVVTGAATCGDRWPHHDPRGEGTVGTAILTRVAATPDGSVTVGPTLGDPAPARALPRVTVRAAGLTFSVIGLHLTSRLPHGPPWQLRRLRAQLPDAGSPMVLAGDCNFWGPGVVATLGGGWRRAVLGRTWPARRPHSQIDHVLVRPGPIRAERGEVLDDVGSDHRPLRVVLCW